MTRFIKNNKAALLALVPVIAVMVMIFLFSAQNAEETKKTSDPLVNEIIHSVIPDYVYGKSNARDAFVVSVISTIVRKGGHIAEFALLGFFTLLHLSKWKKKPRAYGIWAEVFCIFYAATDELHQITIPGRESKVTDVLIDAGGALLGILVMWGILCLSATLKKRKTAKKS